MVDEYENFLKGKIEKLMKGCLTENMQKLVPPMAFDVYGELLDKTHQDKLGTTNDKCFGVTNDFLESTRKACKHQSTQSQSMKEIFKVMSEDLEKMTVERA